MKVMLQVAALSALVDSCALSEIRHLRDVIEPHFQKDFIAALPKELALIVLSQLSAKVRSTIHHHLIVHLSLGEYIHTCL